jgi:hypothetical protein
MLMAVKVRNIVVIASEMGHFHDNFTDSKEMVHFVRQKLKEQNMGFLKRWFYTLNIPRLERWKKKDY